MFGKQVHLRVLRIIGSRVFVHVEGYTTTLQPTAWEGVLVGYNDDSPTVRINDRATGRVIQERHIHQTGAITHFFERNVGRL